MLKGKKFDAFTLYGRVGGKDVTTNISVYRSKLRKQPDDDISKK